MVALLNGFGGGASLTIALAEYYSKLGSAPASLADLLTPVAASADNFGQGPEGTIALVSIGLTVLIGAVTLTGSFVAFTKLQELMKKSYGLQNQKRPPKRAVFFNYDSSPMLSDKPPEWPHP
jgi:NAD(P) transhydrogenase subunit beta